MNYQCASCGQEFLTGGEKQTVSCPVCGGTVQERRIIQYASFWRRAAASTIDLFLFCTPPILITLPFASPDGHIAQPAGLALGFFYIVWVFVAPFIIFALPLRLWGGQTVGKKLLGIVVVDQSGRNLSWAQSLVRPILYFGSYVPMLLGFFWCIWDSRKRCFHDMLAHTLVVRSGEQAALASEAKSREAGLESVLAGRTTEPSQVATPLVASTLRPQREALAATALSFPVKWQRTSGTPLAPRKGAVELHQNRIVFIVWTPRFLWLLALLVVSLGFLLILGIIVAPASMVDRSCNAVIVYALCVALGGFLWTYALAEQNYFGIAYDKVHKVQVNSQQGTLTFWTDDPDPLHHMREACWIGRPDALIRLVTELKDRLEPAVITLGTGKDVSM